MRIEVDGQIGDCVLIANSVGVVGRRDHLATQLGVPITEAMWVGENAALLSDPVAIGSDVWLGYGATILSGVRIGDSAIVGAGAVVSRDVAPNTVVAGNPSRVVGRRFSQAEMDEHWAVLGAKGIRPCVAK
ncbi:DapH/DapD/GlmU-related protein [Blastococcus sp. HT6-30]|uniref:DapH/DapD/GlmU-related protein n=1 Tax=Blastococcus sp. HT6-30 TaxID=3144843 RepID=UPI00321C2C2C